MRVERIIFYKVLFRNRQRTLSCPEGFGARGNTGARTIFKRLKYLIFKNIFVPRSHGALCPSDICEYTTIYAPPSNRGGMMGVISIPRRWARWWEKKKKFCLLETGHES